MKNGLSPAELARNGLSPSVEKWVTRMAPGSRRRYRESLAHFLDWLKENKNEFSDMTPDDLIIYAKNASREKQYNLLDKIQEFVQSRLGLRYGSMKAYYIGLRSFFSHNRAELPRDPNFMIRADVPPVKGILTIENVRDIAKVSNPAYRFVFISMFQTAMGREEFNYWNLNGWESLQKDLKEGKKFITIDLPGRKKFKNVRPYSTFILEGSDAWKALIEYLPHRSLAKEKFDHVQQVSKRSAEKKGRKFLKETFNPNAIVYNNRGRPVSKVAEYVYWSRKCEQLNILKRIGNSDCRNRYGVNPHEMRDLFRSQWEKTPAKPSIGEYLMGHQIDPLEYNKAFRDVPWVISELRTALPMLDIMSSNTPFGLYEKDDIEDIIKQESEKRVAELFKLEKAKMKDQIDELVNLKLQEWAKKSKDLEDKAGLLE